MFVANPWTKVYYTTLGSNGRYSGGGMAYDDGGLTRSEIALVKAWYFADPNIPDVWKYGTDGNGIFKYRKTGTVIKK